MAVALVCGFVGVLVVSGPLGSDPDANKRPTSGDAAPSATSNTLPVVAEAADAGPLDAAMETAPEVVVISASAATSAPTALPPASSIGKTLPTGKRKIPGPEPTTTTKQSGSYDPLREL
jgi:hypothetical protein